MKELLWISVLMVWHARPGKRLAALNEVVSLWRLLWLRRAAR